MTSWAGQEYQRDPLDMIRQSGDEYYIYGPGDERLWTLYAPSGDGSTWLEHYTLRGLGGEVLREFELDGGTETGTWTETDTIYRDGRVLAVVSPTETQHASLDHLGTPRLWTRSNGTVARRPEHLPYGEAAVASFQKLQFTGHERDERGAGTTDDLDYMHARYYSPHLGRFLSVDPADSAQLKADPQMYNRYAYVRGNATNLVDPDGLRPLRATELIFFNTFLHSNFVDVPVYGGFAGRLIKPFAEGVTLGESVVLTETYKAGFNEGKIWALALVGHELAHVQQVREHGNALGFSGRYVLDFMDEYRERGSWDSAYAHLTNEIEAAIIEEATRWFLVDNPDIHHAVRDNTRLSLEQVRRISSGLRDNVQDGYRIIYGELVRVRLKEKE